MHLKVRDVRTRSIDPFAPVIPRYCHPSERRDEPWNSHSLGRAPGDLRFDSQGNSRFHAPQTDAYECAAVWRREE